MPAKHLSQSQRLKHLAINLAGHFQAMADLKLPQSISSRRTDAAIDRSMVKSLSREGFLDLADAGIRIVSILLRVIVGGITFIVIAVVIIRAVRVAIAVTVAPGIERVISKAINHPVVVMPVAPVAIPIMVVIPVPVRMLRGGVLPDDACVRKSLRAPDVGAIRRHLRIQARVEVTRDVWVESGSPRSGKP